jgi:hypothetical protein
MECFAHPGIAAVAVCKHCGKAACRSCVVDAGGSVACSTRCAKEVLEHEEMTQRAKKIYGLGEAKRKVPSGFVMWIVLGTVFFGWGVYNSVGARSIDWFSLLMGVTFLGLGVFAYVRGRDIGLRV